MASGKMTMGERIGSTQHARSRSIIWSARFSKFNPKFRCNMIRLFCVNKTTRPCISHETCPCKEICQFFFVCGVAYRRWRYGFGFGYCRKAAIRLRACAMFSLTWSGAIIRATQREILKRLRRNEAVCKRIRLFPYFRDNSITSQLQYANAPIHDDEFIPIRIESHCAGITVNILIF